MDCKPALVPYYDCIPLKCGGALFICLSVCLCLWRLLFAAHEQEEARLAYAVLLRAVNLYASCNVGEWYHRMCPYLQFCFCVLWAVCALPLLMARGIPCACASRGLTIYFVDWGTCLVRRLVPSGYVSWRVLCFCNSYFEQITSDSLLLVIKLMCQFM